MRFLFTNEEIEAIEAEQYHAGLRAGFALGSGCAVVACGLWALLVGVWS